MIDLESLPEHPEDGYTQIHARATDLAGAPDDIARRVMVHHTLYRDSAGNHAFPLVALHGALWAAGFFETTGKLGDALRLRYIYSRSERTFRMAMLGGFAEGFKTVNRQVFIDTFTNYHYTKRYGSDTRAAGAMHPDLFEALNTMHTATRDHEGLSSERRRALFELALQHEQEVTVAPGVLSEVAKFDCPVLRFLCLRPVVRFAYFPGSTILVFRNFADKTERIAKAMRSYDIAAKLGWPDVEWAVRESKILPASYFEDPRRYVAGLVEAPAV